MKLRVCMSPFPGRMYILYRDEKSRASSVRRHSDPAGVVYANCNMILYYNIVSRMLIPETMSSNPEPKR